MLSNAVSSAVDRLYAATPPVEDLGRVPRVGPVAPVERVRALARSEPSQVSRPRDDRADAQQRHALARGVLAALESSVKADKTAAGQPESAAKSREPGGQTNKVEDQTPDPLLEDAILRFIHTMFRSLAEAEGTQPDGVAAAGSADDGDQPGGVSHRGRNQLGARIEAFAKRLAASAGETPGAAGADAEAPADNKLAGPERSLDEALAEVMKALRGSQGTADSAHPVHINLPRLMQRLAHAMQGAPPVDPGLPTRGALLNERA